MDEESKKTIEEENAYYFSIGTRISEELWSLPKTPSLSTSYDIWNITQDLLKNRTELVPDEIKKKIIDCKTEVFLFTYESDRLKIKAMINHTFGTATPLVYWCRGGTHNFGLPHPALFYEFPPDHTLVFSSYRGGPSEGVDQYGGEDVNDIKQLTEIFPAIAGEIGIEYTKNQVYMFGASRGGMQMFLALERYPELQKKLDGIVCLSGVLDMKEIIYSRPDLVSMFQQFFGMGTSEKEMLEWLRQRDPRSAFKQISKKLPILIINCGNDNRVSYSSSKRLSQELIEEGYNLTVWNIEDASHCLLNRPDVILQIPNWFKDHTYIPKH